VTTPFLGGRKQNQIERERGIYFMNLAKVKIKIESGVA
jgi:hypothetical protein